MASVSQENCQWFSVTEETLFLHDGLMRVTDLVELPVDVNSSHDSENEVISFDLKNPTELSNRLLSVCGNHNNAYAKLLEYRLNALQGLWTAQKQLSTTEESEKESSCTEETISLLKKQGLWKEPEKASFSTRVSVLLIIPLLQSQSRNDPSLCGVTSEVLLSCLKDCAPLSLSKEPGDCLKGLENLLCSWLGEKNESSNKYVVEDTVQRQTIACALVALACARGHLKTFIHTVHLLLSLKDIEYLPVIDTGILSKLMETEGGPGHTPALLGTKHVVCWGFEDLLSGREKESGEKDKSEGEIGRSLAADGVFLYTTNTNGKGLVKVGSGLHGTLRGYIYARNADIGAGKIAVGNGELLYRPQTFDEDSETQNFFQLIDQHTLKPIKSIPKPEVYIESGPCTTVAFCSDGSLFYWVWCPALSTEKNAKGIPVYVECFEYQSAEGIVVAKKSRVTLIKRDEAGAKALNESLLTRLRPMYRGSASALAALAGAENGSCKKDEGQQAGGTTCGILLKLLLKTPMFIDGSHVVLLTSLPGGNASSTARSLFGSSGGLSALRSLATNQCYSLSDGLFVQRQDLMDAPSCSLARGAPIASLGLCFDVTNNVIWLCSNDWVDQFYNPGHEASHHVESKLCIQNTPPHQQADDGKVMISEVIRKLLQHVGSMCLHQIHSDLLYTPFGSYTVQQYPVDYTNLERICDILENSVSTGNTQTTVCALVVLQLIFKMSIFVPEKSKEESVIHRTRDLVWKLISEDSEGIGEQYHVQKEACLVVVSGFTVLYPNQKSRNDLMLKLLEGSKKQSGDPHLGLSCLCDMVLVDLTDQLKGQVTKLEQFDNISFIEDITALLLKIVGRESCSLLRRALERNKDEFECFLTEIPLSSPCLRYLMAMQSFLLRESVLYAPTDDEKSNAGKNTKLNVDEKIKNFAEKVFAQACDVLEVLINCCETVISKNEHVEYYLQGFERVAKATLLGHMLPSLMTALTHKNLQHLNLADVLMPRLVQLVVLSSKAALLLKSSPSETVMDDEVEEDQDSSDIIDIIGQNVEKVDSKDHEEQGFLVGLKIPAPWASGKSVESIHPVRDNYKYKETVHIPGARCLYLRFDNRCASQYDYDKMILYAGPNTTSKKVAEYGGNTYGFGSRSVLGSGWPKDLVRVEGDTVTLSFEMRSGREHNTPDKAMWGFLITVRAQETPEEVSSGLPFLTDLGLGLSVLACSMLQLLYRGPEKNKEEESCQHLLKSKLLQRCVWQCGSSAPSSPKLPLKKQQSTDPSMSPMSPRIPRIKLPSEILKNLLSLTPRHPPHLRPSMKEAIKPDVILERVVSAIVKHLGLEDTVRFFTPSKESQTDEFVLLTSVMEEICKRTDALVRQLQALADLEQRWYTEILDRREDTTLKTSPFFHDFHLQETKLKELSMLCFVKDVTLNTAKLEETINELREKFESELLCTSEEAVDALFRTRQLVDGVLTRLDLLLHVNISPANQTSLPRTVSQCIQAIKAGSNIMVRSDTDIVQSSLMRSVSAPTGVNPFQDDTALDFTKINKRRPKQKPGPRTILQNLVEDVNEQGLPPHVVLIGQLFSFIGSDPEKAVSSEAFLNTAQVRYLRGNTRKQALIHMKELLSAAARVGGATHLVAAVTSVLRHGPR